MYDSAQPVITLTGNARAAIHQEAPNVTMLVERIDALPTSQRRSSRSRRVVEAETVQFAEAALARSKQNGLRLAVRSRWFALAVIAFISQILNPHWEVLYYIAENLAARHADRPRRARIGQPDRF